MTNRIGAIVLGVLLVTGCAGAAGKGSADPPLPSGPGTKRSLVLVEDEAPKAKKPVTEDATSTPAIMHKVIDGR